MSEQQEDMTDVLLIFRKIDVHLQKLQVATYGAAARASAVNAEEERKRFHELSSWAQSIRCNVSNIIEKGGR